MRGLLSKDGTPVPLSSVRITGTIKDIVAELEIVQTYTNTEATPIEAIYSFPLDEGAVVTAFWATVGDRRVMGEVRGKEDARAAYDDAIASGDGAFLAEQHKPDLFVCSVGNMAPCTRAVVHVRVAQLVAIEGEQSRLALPMSLVPKYMPLADRGTPAARTQTGDAAPDVAALEVDAAALARRFVIDLTIQGSSPIASVSSPSHPDDIVVADADGAHADDPTSPATTPTPTPTPASATPTPTPALAAGAKRCTLAGADLQRDFVLLFERAAPRELGVFVECDSARETTALVASLLFRPEAASSEADASELEFVFLIDQSGSMRGPRITNARSALQLFLRSLPHGARCNVYGFGNSHYSVFNASRALDDAALAQLSARVAKIDADMGGTEIYTPLKAILTSARPAGVRVCSVFLLTDGAVSNTARVLELIKSHCAPGGAAGRAPGAGGEGAATTRVFTIGVGSGASTELVHGAARAGQARSEMIGDNERVQPVVARQLKRALQPAMRASVEWGLPFPVATWPSHPPVAFAGERVVFFGLVEGGAEAPARPPTTLADWAAHAGASVVLRDSTAPSSDSADRGPAAAQWAHALDASRMHASAGAHGTSGALHALLARKQVEEIPARQREEIRAIGLRFGIVTAETSLVAVEEREEPGEGGVMAVRKIPLMTPRDTTPRAPMRFARGGQSRRMARAPAPMACARMAFASSAAPSAAPSASATRKEARSKSAALQFAQTIEKTMFKKSKPKSEMQSLSVRARMTERERGITIPISPPSLRMSERECGIPSSALDAIVVLQQADGSWSDASVLRHLPGPGASLDLAAVAASHAQGDTDEHCRLVLTALVVAALGKHFAGQRDEWELLADKSARWGRGAASRLGLDWAMLLAAVAQEV